ncbi:hypothetical protein HXY32_06635 [Candidatus Bathyarchaeota archaeon]|nr:hypothetical protein [Candidatus Bathyarchaeota archaeon]
MGAEQEDPQTQEEPYVDALQLEQEEGLVVEEPMETKNKNSRMNSNEVDRGPFIHGLAVGLGIGCIATFIIVWISVFFTPRIASQITYENLLSIFVYPLIYLLAVGLIALTAGIVREYYAIKNKV